jgi:type I restriction enzyme S subunit
MRETLVKTEEFKDSPVGRIPKDWRVMKIGEACSLLKDGTHLPPKRVESGPLLLSVQNMIDSRLQLTDSDTRISWDFYKTMHRNWEIQVGDVLMAIVGATLGKTAIVPPMPPFTLQRSVAVFRGKPETLKNSFLYLYLSSETFQRLLWHRVNQTAQPGIYLAELAAFYIPLPSLKEQESIAEILDTLDKAIAPTSSLIAKLKQMKAGLLHDLLTQGLDENGELRDAIAHPEQFKDSSLGRIPKDWECGIAQLFCDEIVVGVVCNATDSYVDKGVPFLRSQNIRPNYIDTNGLLYILPTFNALQSKSILHAGDVIIVRTGANTGMTAVVPESLEGANCFSLVVCRPNRAKLNSYFFSHYLNSESCQALMDRTHFGSAQHNFNIGEMNRLLIAVPPLEEQAEIVCRIEAYDTRIRTEEAYRDKLKLQKQGLMHDLLTGKVRVKNA